jgi:spore germination cell wall hydrolase CwlJ-like protein
VKLELRLPRPLAALILATAIAWADHQPIPVIQLAAAAPVVTAADTVAPVVSFVIPKYVLPAANREIIAACLVLEAADQGEFGMRSVMAVIRNRAGGHPELFASTVLRPKQFSALNRLTSGRESHARTLARAQADRMWPVALALVDDAADDSWHDPTNGATHFTRTGERTPWASRLARTTIIGAHSFYR